MSSQKQYAKRQSQEGDVVVHCGHITEDTDIHFWYCDDLPFRRPDGTWGSAKWILGCDRCAKAARGNPRGILIRGDSVWKGNEPSVIAP